MGKQNNRTLIAYLPLVFVATFLVVIAPTLLVFWLRKSGVVTSAWTGTGIGVAVSFIVSYAGAAFWKTRTNSHDILFSELMLWGWIQRWRSERRLIAASDLLGLTTGRPKAIPNGQLTNEQKASLLTQLTSGLEARDPYTHGHSRRVARHASNIAKRMGLSREEVAKIRAAGAMHDVGKLETPIAVLHKESPLSEEEYAIVKRHPVEGATMVTTLEDDELTAMVRHHHERLDGTGYPDQLAGEAIPLGARILAVADTFDAITSTRPYRHSYPHKKALDILTAEAGTQLDPDAVRAFCACYSGRRPLAFWTVLANGRPRFAAWLGGGLGNAQAATAANFLATAAVAAGAGSALAAPLVDPPKDSSPALADSGDSPASSKTPRRSPAPATPSSQQRTSNPARPRSSGSRPGRDTGKRTASGRDTPGRDRSSGRGASGGPPGNGQKEIAFFPDTANGQDTPTGQDSPAGNGNGAGGNGPKGNGNGGNGGGNGNNGGNNGKGNGQDKDKDKDPAVNPPPDGSPGQGNGNGNGKPSPDRPDPPDLSGLSGLSGLSDPLGKPLGNGHGKPGGSRPVRD